MITLSEVQAARERLAKVVHKTELTYSRTFSELAGNEVYLKNENLQKTGSFKIRGAFNKIASLTDEEKQCGVIASSAGNHAQGVALGATLYGIPSTVVMPAGAPLAKVMATRGYGAEVVLHGAAYDDAYAKAVEIQKKTGATFVHPFNDPQVVAGQGTIGLEVLADLPDLDAIVVPIGGGGLISGIAVAVKETKPDVKVIGVQAAGAPSMLASQRAGHITTLSSVATIADGIAVKTPGELTFATVQKYVDDIVTVEEDEIANAILMLLERAKVVAEGAGAAPVAAILQHKINLTGKKVAAVISGGNIDVNILARVIDRGLVKAGRKVQFRIVIPDRPGQLQRVLEAIAGTQSNVVAVYHNRTKRHVAVGFAEVEFVLETQDKAHADTLLSMLAAQGFEVELL
ncbi:MAG TPA: threonine ammonia-lyase [Firmicutes bacterium]|uniref:threonine ammonia-lyase n=1 Tax=Gelria sp. Kuro-4 TaxID=2796927 RepID=UPI0019C080AA|nr:threonine ammonia-lyase [Gelria sp. Kuro-4]MDI3522786.1 threonine dehydratase [Bacillota bacterium]MDK2928047.1 threonine dehydratase [Bacillota bacterium]BCV23380.1 threonine dehydratase [Gelria sp. Kuro-4]HHV58203.1 threonine ammonia-lyase [Bacillota bacterium]